MHEPTLVLNRNWIPVGTATVRHALVLLIRGAARVIEPQTYEVLGLEGWLIRSMDRERELPRERQVSTPRYLVEKPEVMLLSNYGKVPRTHVAFSRRNLFRRDDHRCQYCGRRGKGSELSIDHVLPRSRGGPTSWENCVLACLRCNSRKADRTPAEVGLRLARKPVRPRWSPILDTLPAARPSSWQRFLGKLARA
ncbi:MAG: HNH endonuclease [Planctomycetes bacterium]|nr:HNH endonuclease [Planctomycetota bacterium]